MGNASRPAHAPCLSACIIAFNEENRIAECVASLACCDEVLVVDSHSTDRTREIAASRGARVIERDWPGYVAQKEFAVRGARHDWVLCLDADERVSPALQDELIALRDAGFPGRAGWEIPRLTWYLGRWIRHGTWYPDRSIRLFDRRHGKWVGHPSYALHEHVELDGAPGRLRHDIWHYPYRTLADHLRTIDHYTTIIAEGLHQHGRPAGLRDLVLRPSVAFVRFYWLKMGFLDGWRGLLLAYLHAYYVRMKYAKLFVLSRAGESDEPRSLLGDRREDPAGAAGLEVTGPVPVSKGDHRGFAGSASTRS
jgi:glycosyltransferase involved in cell wall biosynthesis